MEEKNVEKIGAQFLSALKEKGIPDADRIAAQYRKRLTDMYASDLYKEHNVYPTMNVPYVYAVIAMCLELRDLGKTDSEIMDIVNTAFRKRKEFFAKLIKCINILPNSYQIAKNWNISDHDKRVKDGSITYDTFVASDRKVEYSISKCKYVDMFEAYGIRKLCKIFCNTDINAYTGLTRHVKFIRHSDLSDGPCCHDEVLNRKYI